jgi:hypothetical protein
MDSKLIYKYWEIIKKNLVKDFQYLENKDLEYIRENEKDLIEKIMNKTGQSKEEVLYLIYLYIMNAET